MNASVQQAFDAEDFRQQGHALVDMLANYLQEAQQGKPMAVLPYKNPEQQLEQWKKDWEQSPSIDTIPSFFEAIIESNIHLLHPKYVGHQVTPPLPLAALSDMLASMLNPGAGVYEMGSPVIALERIIVQQVAERMGFGSEADGFLTSGGSLGNLTALLAASKVQLGQGIWQEGNQSALKPAVMVSGESHYCVNRAVKIMGWGEAGIISVPVNERFQMDAQQLEPRLREAEAQGFKVIAVVANACSTATGSYDPVEKIADFCEKHQLWLHIDGAHGGAAIFSEKYKSLLKGLERADSMVLDFHKMMLTPALTTILLFKKGDQSYQTFAQKADYLWTNAEDAEWFNPSKRTLECTKSAMSLRFYLLLRTYGWEIFEEHLTHMYDLGKAFAQMIQETEGFELLMEPDSNIVCFRFVGDLKDMAQLNVINRQIRQAIIEEGSFYLVQTIVNDALYLRTTLINPFTTTKELSALLTKISNFFYKMRGKLATLADS